MNSNEVFDNSADLYDAWFEKNNYIFNSEILAIKQLLPIFDKGIEIGVGTGIFASLLGVKDGVEPSKIMSDKAIKRGINVITAKAEDLPIANETYELALMVTVDCFLEDIEKAFKEVWRIISKNGYFIIAFIDRKTPLGEIYDQMKASDEFYTQAKFHSAEEITHLIETVGFVILDQKQTVFTLDNKHQEIKDGVGEGVFAVIKAKKIKN